MSLFELLQDFLAEHWLIVFALIGITVVINIISRIARMVRFFVTSALVLFIICWVMITVQF